MMKELKDLDKEELLKEIERLETLVKMYDNAICRLLDFFSEVRFKAASIKGEK